MSERALKGRMALVTGGVKGIGRATLPWRGRRPQPKRLTTDFLARRSRNQVHHMPKELRHEIVSHASSVGSQGSAEWF